MSSTVPTMNHDQAFWLPYTANRAFWKSPRVIKAARGHYYTAEDGKQLLRVAKVQRLPSAPSLLLLLLNGQERETND